MGVVQISLTADEERALSSEAAKQNMGLSEFVKQHVKTYALSLQRQPSIPKKKTR